MILFISKTDIAALIYPGLTAEKFLKLVGEYVENLGWFAYLAAENMRTHLRVEENVEENYDALPLLRRVAEMHREAIGHEANLTR